MTARPRVFLSHATPDRRFASRLADVLTRHGVGVWYSRTTLRGAQQWHDEIGKALRTSNWLVLVLSPASVQSRWVKRELGYALRKTRYEDRIVPLVFKRCKPEKLSWTLDDFEQVDFTRSFDAGCRDLLRIWGKRYLEGRTRR